MTTKSKAALFSLCCTLVACGSTPTATTPPLAPQSKPVVVADKPAPKDPPAEQENTDCAGADAKDCAEAANVLLRVPGNEKIAIEKLDKACTAKYWPACATLARMYDEGERVPANGFKAVDLHSRACEHGIVESCMASGDLLFQGSGGIPQNRNDGIRQYQSACDQGDARACRIVGYLFFDDVVVPRNFARATELFKKACDGNDLVSCLEYAGVIFEGNGIGKDQARAVQLYEKLCVNGSMAACNRFGEALETGAGTAKSEARALEMYTNTCERGANRDTGNLDACMNLARFVEQGKGIKKDATRALMIRSELCESDRRGDACVALADSFSRGNGVKADAKHAQALYERGCKLGSPTGCVRAGQSCGKDKHGESAACEKDCAQGDQHACMLSGMFLQEGTGVAKDRKRAGDLYAQACALGQPSACVAGFEQMSRSNRTWRHRPNQIVNPQGFIDACRNGDIVGCRLLAALDEEHSDALIGMACMRGDFMSCIIGPISEGPQFISNAETACEAHSANACGFIASTYAASEKDRDVKMPKVIELATKSCNWGSALGCGTLAIEYLYGNDTINKDVKRAINLFTQVCNGLGGQGCYDVGDIYFHGKDSVKANPTEAKKWFVRGCAMKHERSCSVASSF